MSAIRGWESSVVFPAQQLTDERMLDTDGNDATGDGAKTTFYSRSFPITDSAGATTDDENDVTVKVAGVAQDPTDFTLTGAEGKIVFAAAPASGTITITHYYAKTVGYAQTVSMSHAPGVEPVREIGARGPVELKEGNIDIGLTLERCWLDRDMLGKVSSLTDLPEFTVNVYPKKVGAGKPILQVVGKFNGWSFELGQDAILMETIEFIGKTITVGTQ